MNLIISAIFVFLALTLLLRPLVVLIMNWVIHRPSLKRQVVTLFVFGSGLMLYATSLAQWYYHTGALALFVVGLLAIAEGLVIVLVGENKYRGFVRYCANRYWIISAPSIALLVFLAGFLAFRSYIGPIPDVGECRSGDELKVLCGFEKPPEDMVLTPDDKFLLVSEFGGIAAFVEAAGQTVTSGRLSFLELSTLNVIRPAISYSDNSWGDGYCRRDKYMVFNPHGIDLIQRNDGRYQVAVVTHGPMEAVDMFELVAEEGHETHLAGVEPIPWRLVWRGCVEAPSVNFFNGVAVAPDGSFFVTHMHGRDFSLNDYLLATLTKPDTGYVLRWDRDVGFSQVPATEGGQPNGIAYDSQNGVLHVAFNLSDRVDAIDLVARSVIASYSVDAPDNLVLKEGSLWITSLLHQPMDGLVCERYPCALPFSIIELDASDYREKTKWDFRGQPFGLPTVALPTPSVDGEKQVFIGTFLGSRMARMIAE